jgi:hypothetical protein
MILEATTLVLSLSLGCILGRVSMLITFKSPSSLLVPLRNWERVPIPSLDESVRHEAS